MASQNHPPDQTTPGVTDRYARPLQDLRISLTDRCNFRCTYCMPRELFGSEHLFLPRRELLDFEEIERLARIAAGLGVTKLRLTGGEPLLRRDIDVLIARLAAIDGIDDICLTTNGSLLTEQRARELAVGVVNGSYSADDRKAVAKELRAIEKQLIDQANARDAQGEYMFAGFQSRKEPMQYNASTQSYQYVSDQGARNIQLTPNLKLAANEPGSKPFANVSQRVDINVESGQNLVGELRVSNREQFTDFTEQQQSNGNPGRKSAAR